MSRLNRYLGFRSGILLGVLLLCSALAGAGSIAAAPLGQAANGTVTGKVMSGDNVALANIRMAAYNQDPSTPNRTPLAEFQTDASGNYSVQVPAGTVWISVLTQDYAQQTIWGYSSLPVEVAAGQTVSGQDFRMSFGAIAGPGGSAVPPSVPKTGAGMDPILPLGVALGLLLVLAGLVQRRLAAR